MAGTTNDKQPTFVLALVDPALEPKVEAQLLWVDPCNSMGGLGPFSNRSFLTRVHTGAPLAQD